MRTAPEALSAVLGGTQSLHTNSFTIDPLGGSYFVEHLTDKLEECDTLREVRGMWHETSVF